MRPASFLFSVLGSWSRISVNFRDEFTLNHDIGVCFDFTAYSEAFEIFDNIEGMQF